jgi:hypothetical protein
LFFCRTEVEFGIGLALLIEWTGEFSTCPLGRAYTGSIRIRDGPKPSSLIQYGSHEPQLLIGFTVYWKQALFVLFFPIPLSSKDLGEQKTLFTGAVGN